MTPSIDALIRDQLEMNVETVSRLLDFEEARFSALHLDFSFDGPTRAGGHALVEDLRRVGARAEMSETDGGGFHVEAVSEPMLISQGLIDAWVTEMCRLGHRHGFWFDGWGTSVDGSASLSPVEE